MPVLKLDVRLDALADADSSPLEVVEPDYQKRGGFDHYGQTLPDWLTYAEHATTVNGEIITTGSIADLPLTYYGPSIPLGSGWSYGGPSSPVMSTPPSTVSNTGVGNSMTAESKTLPMPTIVIPIPATSDLVLSTLTSTLSSVKVFSMPTTTSSPLSGAIASSSSTAFPTIGPSDLTMPTSSSTTGSAPSPSRPPIHGPDTGSDLVPLLPAVLIPLALLLVLLILAAYLIHRYRTYQPSTIHPNEPPRWLPSFLLPLVFPRRNGYRPAIAPSTPPKKSRAPLLDPRSPDEKSALLTGFTPQHHRQSSSISWLTEEAQYGHETTARGSDQSLLERLGLSGGLFSTSPAEPRKPSGFLLEKGLRVSSYTSLPLPPRRRPNTGSSGSDNHTPLGSRDQISSSNLRSIADEQLFFRAPIPTTSSKATSTGSKAASSLGTGPAANGWRSRLSTPSRGGSGMEGEVISLGIPETPDYVDGEIDMGEFGRRPIWTASSERLRFPIPPSSTRVSPAGSPPLGQGTFGLNAPDQRDSIITTDSNQASFHTAASHQESSERNAAEPVVYAPTPGEPIDRRDIAYRHAALSAFGSTPTTPSGTPVQSLSHHTSSHDHTSPSQSADCHATLSPPPPTTTRVSWIRSPFGPVPVSSDPYGGNVRAPMQGLFVTSPPPSDSFSDEGSTSRNRASFAGAPFANMTIQEGRMEQMTVGEFGEPLRPGAESSPTVLYTRRHIQDRTSEIASVYSHPSRAPSDVVSSSSGSQSSHGRIVSDRAVRGRRSQPQLFQASRLQAFSASDTPVPHLSEEERRGYSAQAQRGWFGQKRG